MKPLEFLKPPRKTRIKKNVNFLSKIQGFFFFYWKLGKFYGLSFAQFVSTPKTIPPFPSNFTAKPQRADPASLMLLNMQIRNPKGQKQQTTPPRNEQLWEKLAVNLVNCSPKTVKHNKFLRNLSQRLISFRSSCFDQNLQAMMQ